MFRITVDSALLYYGFFELGSPFSSFHLFSFGARPEISPLVTVWAASHTLTPIIDTDTNTNLLLATDCRSNTGTIV